MKKLIAVCITILLAIFINNFLAAHLLGERPRPFVEKFGAVELMADTAVSIPGVPTFRDTSGGLYAKYIVKLVNGVFVTADNNIAFIVPSEILTTDKYRKIMLLLDAWQKEHEAEKLK